MRRRPPSSSTKACERCTPAEPQGLFAKVATAGVEPPQSYRARRLPPRVADHCEKTRALAASASRAWCGVERRSRETQAVTSAVARPFVVVVRLETTRWPAPSSVMRGRDVREQCGETVGPQPGELARACVRQLAPPTTRSCSYVLPPFEVLPGQPVEPASTTRRPRRRRGARLAQAATSVRCMFSRSRSRDFLPPPLLASTETRVGSMGRVWGVVPSRGRCGSRQRLSTLSVGRELGDGLDHAKPSLGLRCRVHEQALVDEGGERGQHGQRVAAHDRPCGFDRERIAEHAETSRTSRSGSGEELVAPVDRRAHRLLARRGVSTTVAGASSDDRGVEETRGANTVQQPRQARRRAATRPRADRPRAPRGRSRRPRRRRTNGGNALHEERRRTPRAGDRVRVLPLQSKRLAAGREHLQSAPVSSNRVTSGAAASRCSKLSSRSRGCRSGRVERDQAPDPARATGSRQLGDRRRHEIRVCEPVERDVCRTVGKSRSEPASNLEGEARLADAAGPRQSHESHVAALQQPQELAELVVAPDERGRASREPGSLLPRYAHPHGTALSRGAPGRRPRAHQAPAPS